MTGIEKGLAVAAVGALLTIVTATIRLTRPAQQELPAEEPAMAICVQPRQGMWDCRLPDGARCVTFGLAIACDFSAESHIPPLPPCDISTLGLRAGPVQCIFDPHLGHRWAWKPLP